MNDAKGHLTKLARVINQAAKDNGWYDGPERTPLEFHMLIVSEVAEATEAVRKGLPALYVKESGKPDGEAVEVADAIIRALDYCGHRGWDISAIIDQKLAYNKTRGYRHGGKAI